MSNTFEVRYTPAAERDLSKIARTLARARGKEFALGYVKQLQDRADTLTSSPRRYRVRERLGKECRLMPELPYHIYYRVATNYVLVLRILHGRRIVARRTIRQVK